MLDSIDKINELKLILIKRICLNELLYKSQGQSGSEYDVYYINRLEKYFYSKNFKEIKNNSCFRVKVDGLFMQSTDSNPEARWIACLETVQLGAIRNPAVGNGSGKEYVDGKR